MKRVVVALLSLAMVLSLVACGSSSDGEVKETSDVSGDGSVQKEEVSAPKEVTIDETVVLDENGVKITAKSLGDDGFWGPEIKLLIENNSGKSVTVQAQNVSVNGYAIENALSADVADGMKANDALELFNSDLKLAGIETIADVEWSFHIFDSDSWLDSWDSATIRLETSAAAGYEYTYDESGDVIYDKDGLTVIVKGLDDDGILVYLKNETDSTYTFQVRDTSVNGFMVDDYFSCDVPAGKRGLDTISFSSSDLEANEITAIEHVQFYLHMIHETDILNGIDSDIISLDF